VNTIEDGIQRVREKIAGACARAGRSEKDVRLVAVTKGVDVARIRIAFSCGVQDFGENYIQEAKGKIEDFGEGPYWHMIGHIQTNKVKYIPGLFSYVHSVDRWEILEGLEKFGKPMKVLFELNLSGEKSKHGTQEDNLRRMLEKMHIFSALRRIMEKANREFSLNMRELSMGMSSDFEVAIEEGATMVRVGTAIFGERQ
jgi:uncharacterized pyridoxal phosphate-containing UPF0001 family protein